MRLSVLPRLILLLALSAAACAAPRDRSFDDGWRFHRGNAAGAEQPDFDDAGWRPLDLPHDWSIEDAPRADDVLDLRTGPWEFRPGDGAWACVVAPHHWRAPGEGWYRRTVEAAPGHALLLDLGTVMGTDETFFNGTRVGGNGAMQADYDPFWTCVYQRQRTYEIPAGLVRAENVVTVHTFCSQPFGGLYETTPGTRVGPFDPAESPGNTDTGYTVGGVGWYRKHFVLHEAGKAVTLRFDGVYMDADVWINGHHLGEHPYGYTPFGFDITPFLKANNVVAVRVRNLGRNSRWYSGSGIYRHTWLSVTPPKHIENVAITTPNPHQVCIAANLPVRVTILDPDGVAVGQGSSEVHIAHPRVWGPDHPELYRARIEAAGDHVEIPFGIRTIAVDAVHGLRINGQPIKLRGGCVHHDNGPLGSAAIDRAEVRRVELLKACGFNAIRTSHNPPSPAFLDACDRLGMLVMEEAFDQWRQGKTENDYHRSFATWWQRDFEAMVRRDGNHPSVIMWSIGNEIPERKTAGGAQDARRLADFVRRLDPSRPVTSAFNEVTEAADDYFSALDVCGYNYNPERYDDDHRRHPQRVMVCTESLPDRAGDYWHAVERSSWVIGDFVWTAMDYIGESGIGHPQRRGEVGSYLLAWPWHLSNCGDLDICGFKKPQSYFRDVLWGKRKVAIAVQPPGVSEAISSWPDKGPHFTWGWPTEARHWTWPVPVGTPLHVRVYASAPSVRLRLNGRDVGVAPVDNSLTATFDVPYEPGVLEALAGGATDTLRTAGPPVGVRLSADRPVFSASCNDLCYVTVEAVDAAGTPVPDAAHLIHFAIQGPAELAGVGNGDPCDLASFQQPQRHLYQGRALAILRPHGPPGPITFVATPEGLPAATLQLSTRQRFSR